jgi:hypothetical protein
MKFTPIPDELGIGRFPYFVCYMLRELNLADEPTKQQLGICDWMENGPVDVSGAQRSITCGFRGVAKSTLAAFRALHRLRIDPFREKVLIPGSTTAKAEEISTFMLRCIHEIDLLRCLEPRIDGRQSVKAFDVGPSIVDQSPSARVAGILSSSLTGKRASFIIPDDIETLNNSITPMMQERLAKAVTELESILFPDEGQALPRAISFLGTPHLESSLYLRLHRERGYPMRYWPARYPDPNNPDEWDCYEGNLDPLIAQEVKEDPSLVGRPTDPERFDENELRSREMRMPKTTFLLQFQLNCRPATLDRFPIRLADLIVMPLDGKALPEVVGWSNAMERRIQHLPCVGIGADRYYHSPAIVGSWIPRETTWRCVMAIDPSGRGRSELAWSVVAELNGNLFELASGGSQAGYESEILGHLAQVAKRWGVKVVIVEDNLGDGMFRSLLEPHFLKAYPCPIEGQKVTGGKEARIIDTLAPLIQQHRLIVNEAVIRGEWTGAEKDPEQGHLYTQMYQLSRITVERGSLPFYDRADALEMACRHYVDAAAQDQVTMARQRREEEELEQLRLWLEDDSLDRIAMGFRRRGEKPAWAQRG